MLFLDKDYQMRRYFSKGWERVSGQKFLIIMYYDSTYSSTMKFSGILNIALYFTCSELCCPWLQLCLGLLSCFADHIQTSQLGHPENEWLWKVKTWAPLSQHISSVAGMRTEFSYRAWYFNQETLLWAPAFKLLKRPNFQSDLSVYFLKTTSLLTSSNSLDQTPEVNNTFKMFFSCYFK